MACMKPRQLVQIQRVGIKTTLTLSIRLSQCLHVVGYWYAGADAGSFAFSNYSGDVHGSISFHVVLVP